MYNEIKELLLEARKARHSARSSLLIGLVDDIDKKVLDDRKKSEASDEEFIVPDSEVVSVLKNTIKNLEKSVADIISKVGPCDASEDLTLKANALRVLLPEAVAGDDLRLVIQSLGASNMGQAMKLLKVQSMEVGFDYDGKEASTLAKELFL